MKITAASLVISFVWPSLAHSQVPSAVTHGPVKDALGTWKTEHFPQAGISLESPCAPELSYSDANDGYGHKGDRVTLKCNVGPLGPGGASFRIERWWYKKNPGLIAAQFKEYMDLIRSMAAGTYKGPRVMIAGQQREGHQDFTLTQRSVHGDLGYHDTADECSWNFYGLAGDSIVQAVMVVPKNECPASGSYNLTDAARRFYGSIIIDGI